MNTDELEKSEPKAICEYMHGRIFFALPGERTEQQLTKSTSLRVAGARLDINQKMY